MRWLAFLAFLHFRFALGSKMIFLPELFTFLAKSWVLVLVSPVCLPQKLQQISSVFFSQFVSVHGLHLQSYINWPTLLSL